jgi:hypothetical protein
MVKAEDVEKLKAAAAKESLRVLIRALDELDLEDFFGTEGWRKYLGFE